MSPGSKIALALLILALLTYLPYHVVKHDSSADYRRLSIEVDRMRAGNEALQGENDRLRHKIASSRTDPQLMERLARDRLLLVRPDELILVFPKESSEVGR